MKRSYHRFWVFNSLFWAASFLLLLFLFSGRKNPEKIDFIYTLCFTLTLLIPVLANIYIFIPRFLKKEKYLLFLVLFSSNLFIFTELNPLFFDFIIDSFFNDYYFISYHNRLERYFIFFIFFILSSLIWLGEDWIYLNKLEKQILTVEKEQAEKQLYYLKGQINPHFLFNALNVLYALAIEEKKEITNAILQLSDILRYVIYDVEADKIPLKKEVSLIENYVAFEKNRQMKNAKINFNFKIDESLKIYPMLLLPIIENSFKHGLKSGVQHPFVTINLTTSKSELLFKVSNNFKKKLEKENDYQGIGLKNIQKNLQLIYPNKHHFKTEINKTVFTVIISINLKDG